MPAPRPAPSRAPDLAPLRAARSLAALRRALEDLDLVVHTDEPLAALIDDPALSARVAARLVELAFDVSLGTVGDLLYVPASLAWLNGQASAPERRELVERIRGRVECRLEGETPATGVRPLPERWDGVVDWSQASGVTQHLREDVSILLPRLPEPVRRHLDGRLPKFPLGHLATEAVLPFGRLPADALAALRQAARAHLMERAAQVQQARAASDPAAPDHTAPGGLGASRDPALAALHGQLTALRQRLVATLGWQPPMPGWLGHAAEHALVYAGGDLHAEARILLPHLGRPTLELACTCLERSARHRRPPPPLTAAGEPACVHLLAAAEGFLELLDDPAPPESSEPLLTALRTPPWRRLVHALGGLAARDQAGPAQRLAWRITGYVGRRFDLQPIVQKLGRHGKYSKGRVVRALDLVTRSEVTLTPRDRQVLGLLLAGDPFGFGQETTGVGAAFSALAGHPHVSLDIAPQVPVSVRRRRLGLGFEPQGEDLRLVCLLGDDPIDPGHLLDALTPDGPEAILVDPDAGTCDVVHLPQAQQELLDLVAGLGGSLPAEAGEALVDLVPSLQDVLPVRLPESLRGEPVDPDHRPVARVTVEAGPTLTLALRVRPAPGGPALAPGEGPDEVTGTADGRRVYARRHRHQETEAVTQVVESLGLHEDWTEAGTPFTWCIPDPDAALDVLAALEDAAAEGHLVVEWLDETPTRLLRRAHRGDLRLQVSRKRDWFGLEGGLKAGDDEVDLALLLNAVREGRRWVQARGGAFVALSQALREALGVAADVVHKGRGGLEVTAGAAFLLEDLAQDGRLDAPDAFHALVRRVREASRTEAELPAGLQASLRPYQVDGFRWLSRLAAWGVGGVLADDMGLGKTVEALALLLHRAEAGPALVVAPTSVCGNWVREAERFAPGLRPVLYRELSADGREEARERLGPGDLLVVSYGLLARDAERLAGRTFATLILDEAQAIKNPATRRARAARDLHADLAVALTGTPIENHLGELWSIFRVVFPGLLGSHEAFRERFARPVERGDTGRRRALSRLLRPFVLRRTKAEVAPELPARTSIEVPVALSAAERRQYEQVRLATAARLEGRDGSLPPEQQRFEILAALTRLRLLACHPRLFDPASSLPSAKLARLIEVLDELREEGHRALVFSQFTKHLALVREALDARGVCYAYLDGSTPAARRDTLVAEFQAGAHEAFLISLKAGGTGLNLTAADYVIHLDPWWNPATEDQATDRAHRIGQDRPVTVLRLVAQDTIEEQILSLHAEKRALVAGVLEGTGAAARIEVDALVRLLRAPAGVVGDEEDDEGDGEGGGA